MKLILNCLLYVTQWLHLRMGGEVYVSRGEIILKPPKGRHCVATEESVELELAKN